MQIDIQDTDSYSDSSIQVIAHSNLLFNNNSYKKFYLHSKTYNMGLKWNLYLT